MPGVRFLTLLGVEMLTRVDWLKWQWQYGRRERLPLTCSIFLVFEAYYQLCAVLGYKPRHALLDSSPASLRAIPPGARVMLVWPRLPLLVRLLERVWPYAYGSHAEFVPYTPEAFAEARASGRRAEVWRRVPGEVRSVGSVR